MVYYGFRENRSLLIHLNSLNIHLKIREICRVHEPIQKSFIWGGFRGRRYVVMGGEGIGKKSNFQEDLHAWSLCNIKSGMLSL